MYNISIVSEAISIAKLIDFEYTVSSLNEDLAQFPQDIKTKMFININICNANMFTVCVCICRSVFFPGVSVYLTVSSVSIKIAYLTYIQRVTDINSLPGRKVRMCKRQRRTLL